MIKVTSFFPETILWSLLLAAGFPSIGGVSIELVKHSNGDREEKKAYLNEVDVLAFGVNPDKSLLAIVVEETLRGNPAITKDKLRNKLRELRNFNIPCIGLLVHGANKREVNVNIHECVIEAPLYEVSNIWDIRYLVDYVCQHACSTIDFNI